MIRARLVLALMLLWPAASSGAPATPTRFPSPEAAITALVQAVRAGDTAALLRVLGPDAKALIASGDEVADRQSRERFVRAYDEAHRLAEVSPGRLVLTVGRDEWPMPIPLVRDAAGWWFDHPGREEILNRRVGRNELSAMQVCLAYVDAQREYYCAIPTATACCSTRSAWGALRASATGSLGREAG